MRLLKPIPDDKVDVELSMSAKAMHGLDSAVYARSCFMGVHMKGYLGFYGESRKVDGTDWIFIDYSKEHICYFIVGFNLVKVIVAPENKGIL